VTAADSDGPVVLVTTDRGGDSLASWFPDLWSAERNHLTLSASRHGVKIHGAYLHEVPDEWIESAKQAYAALRTDRAADVSHLATHRHHGVSNGPLVPIEGGGR